MANVQRDDYSLTLDRDEVWRGALIFYETALGNSDILRNNLTIAFKGKDGLDAVSLKPSFVAMLNEMQLHFEVQSGLCFL